MLVETFCYGSPNTLPKVVNVSKMVHKYVGLRDQGTVPHEVYSVAFHSSWIKEKWGRCLFRFVGFPMQEL